MILRVEIKTEPVFSVVPKDERERAKTEIMVIPFKYSIHIYVPTSTIKYWKRLL